MMRRARLQIMTFQHHKPLGSNIQLLCNVMQVMLFHHLISCLSIHCVF
uniref:Uncharacterized protein n=1 Tax=Ciona intestinalis TaxID=7719 RepID=H2XPM1_CIOIN